MCDSYTKIGWIDHEEEITDFITDDIINGGNRNIVNGGNGNIINGGNRNIVNGGNRNIINGNNCKALFCYSSDKCLTANVHDNFTLLPKFNKSLLKLEGDMIQIDKFIKNIANKTGLSIRYFNNNKIKITNDINKCYFILSLKELYNLKSIKWII